MEATIARVAYAENGGYHLVAQGEHRNLPLFLPPGFASLPREGENVLILPVDGRLGVVGCKVSFQRLDPGEVRLFSAGGGEIHLRNDGSISLNGLIITKDGKLEAL